MNCSEREEQGLPDRSHDARLSGLHDIDSYVWVFGYGSLLWKPNFPYEGKVVGYVEGYARRFWQGSTDHRGVPGSPGRVVTLVQMQGEQCWGVAFQVHPCNVQDILVYLDHREKGGYSTHRVTFYPQEESTHSKHPFTVLVYIATESNPEYLGPAPTDTIARQVIGSRGPSGCNLQYVVELMQAMRKIAATVHDRHLVDLEVEIRRLLLQDEHSECKHQLVDGLPDCVCKKYIGCLCQTLT